MPRLRTLTVRQRISLAVAALVSSALIVTGVTVYVVESRRIDAAIETTIANELAGFRKFAPDQPVTARLTSYLESSFPPAGSAMWAFNADGTVTFVGPDAKALRTAQTFPKEPGGSQSAFAVASTSRYRANGDGRKFVRSD